MSSTSWVDQALDQWKADMRSLDQQVRYVRFYPALARLFAPYARADAVTRTRQDGGTYKAYIGSFSPICAAVLLMNVMEFTGTSTYEECRGTDWFIKNDREYADELGMGMYELRAARTFLSAGGVRLIDYRVAYNPTRVMYRAVRDRITAFISPRSSGYGQLALPLGVPLEAPLATPLEEGVGPPVTPPVTPREEKPNVTLGKNERDVRKNLTSREEKPHISSKYDRQQRKKNNNSTPDGAQFCAPTSLPLDAADAGLPSGTHDRMRKAAEILTAAGVELADVPALLPRLKDRPDVEHICRLVCGLVGQKDGLHNPAGLVVRRLQAFDLTTPDMDGAEVDRRLAEGKRTDTARRQRSRGGTFRRPQVAEYTEAEREAARVEARQRIDERARRRAEGGQ